MDSLITYENLKAIIEKKGFKFFTKEMDVNFIGIRTANRIADNYDDYFALCWVEDGSQRIWVNSKFTTDPGIYYLKTKLLNPNGCAILVPNQYRSCWKLGMHGNKNPYEAFVQVGKMDFYRDRDRDNEIEGDPTTIESGIIGLNQHHGYDSANVGPNSAGCQVHKLKESLNFVKDVFKRSIPLHGERVSYTLLTHNDFKS